MSRDPPSSSRPPDSSDPPIPTPNSPAEDAETLPVSPRAPSAPRTLGPYRILRKLGEGGMGEVYEAEQEKPLRRRVALKVIKRGMDTEQVLARFEAERQALALMDHPNIAKVLDAGATKSGRPYFVMECVHGLPITEHCDRHRLPTRERLELFAQVCQAVQHAHQKAVIHRDLKPSNVLVAFHDGKAVPKIIDFGVAKALAQPLTERTLYTEEGQLLGTPEYMSPEQAEMTGRGIDTRTDVYSLGAMLYELLVGVRPFDSNELRRAGFEGIRRIVCEVDPPRPSTRIISLGERSRRSAENRRASPRTLAGELRGDLDWITMKALEKEPDRRYGSPAELAADIARHLRNEPVTAGAPSTFYRVRKFARRHRVAVGLASGVVLVLAGVAARERMQSHRIALERDRANREAEAARRVSDFLVELFAVSDPSENRGNTITAREILDEGARKIGESLGEDPELRAQLTEVMGNVYRRLGLFEAAAPLLEEALAIRRRTLGEEDPQTLSSITSLANLHWELGRYERAESLFVSTLEISRRVLGPDHPATLEAAENFGAVRLDEGRYEEALLLLEEASAAKRRVLGEDDPSTLVGASRLGKAYRDLGRLAEAESVLTATFHRARGVLGDDHPRTLAFATDLAIVYAERGRFDKAERLFREILETRRRVLGEEHPRTAAARALLASVYMDERKPQKAAPLLQAALGVRRRVLGEEHPLTLNTMNDLATLHMDLGEPEKAAPLLQEVLEARRRVLGEEHPETLTSMANLATFYCTEGRFADAEPLFDRVLAVRRRSLGEEHRSTLICMNNLANLYMSTGRTARAESLLIRVLGIRRRVLGEGHPETLTCRYDLACLYAAQGEKEKAIAHLRAALEHGFRAAWIRADPDLAPLRGDPEFEAIVQGLKERAKE